MDVRPLAHQCFTPLAFLFSTDDFAVRLISLYKAEQPALVKSLLLPVSVSVCWLLSGPGPNSLRGVFHFYLCLRLHCSISTRPETFQLETNPDQTVTATFLTYGKKGASLPPFLLHNQAHLLAWAPVWEKGETALMLECRWAAEEAWKCIGQYFQRAISKRRLWNKGRLALCLLCPYTGKEDFHQDPI